MYKTTTQTKNTTMLALCASLLALCACSNTKNNDVKNTAQEPPPTTDASTPDSTQKTVAHDEATKPNVNKATSALSQAESDKKLEQVADLQYGKKIEVTNKANETKLYETSHYQQALYKEILGIWTVVKNTKLLKQMNMPDDIIAKSKVELSFMPDHDMEMRTYGTASPADTPFIKTGKNGVTVMTGRYIIRDGVINIYFGRDAMQDQTIEINDNIMTLAPVGDDSGFKLDYKRVKNWSLKKD